MGLPLQGEVAQDTEAESLTFLGVELGANNIPFAGSGSEAEAVVAVGAHNGIVFRLRVSTSGQNRRGDSREARAREGQTGRRGRVRSSPCEVL